jgi:excisionase family DNA binding protein
LEPQTITIREAARVLGISRNMAYELAHSGALPVLKLGGGPQRPGRILVVKEGLQKMLLRAEVQGR